MIPHHSMAILMSDKLLQKVYNNTINITPEIKKLANIIITNQEDEINYMKFQNKKIHFCLIKSRYLVLFLSSIAIFTKVCILEDMYNFMPPRQSNPV